MRHLLWPHFHRQCIATQALRADAKGMVKLTYVLRKHSCNLIWLEKKVGKLRNRAQTVDPKRVFAILQNVWRSCIKHHPILCSIFWDAKHAISVSHSHFFLRQELKSFAAVQSFEEFHFVALADVHSNSGGWMLYNIRNSGAIQRKKKGFSVVVVEERRRVKGWRLPKLETLWFHLLYEGSLSMLHAAHALAFHWRTKKSLLSDTLIFRKTKPWSLAVVSESNFSRRSKSPKLLQDFLHRLNFCCCSAHLLRAHWGAVIPGVNVESQLPDNSPLTAIQLSANARHDGIGFLLLKTQGIESQNCKV